MNAGSKAHANVKEVVPFLHVSSMERSVRYCAEFAMSNDSPGRAALTSRRFSSSYCRLHCSR
jgi:hypothetical protein